MPRLLVVRPVIDSEEPLGAEHTSTDRFTSGPEKSDVPIPMRAEVKIKTVPLLVIAPACSIALVAVLYLLLKPLVPSQIAIHAGSDGVGYGSTVLMIAVACGIAAVAFGIGGATAREFLKDDHWFQTEKSIAVLIVSLGVWGHRRGPGNYLQLSRSRFGSGIGQFGGHGAAWLPAFVHCRRLYPCRRASTSKNAHHRLDTRRMSACRNHLTWVPRVARGEWLRPMEAEPFTRSSRLFLSGSKRMRVFPWH